MLRCASLAGSVCLEVLLEEASSSRGGLHATAELFCGGCMLLLHWREPGRAR